MHREAAGDSRAAPGPGCCKAPEAERTEGAGSAALGAGAPEASEPVFPGTEGSEEPIAPEGDKEALPAQVAVAERDRRGQPAALVDGVLAGLAGPGCSPPHDFDDRYHLFVDYSDYTWQLTCPKNFWCPSD